MNGGSIKLVTILNGVRFSRAPPGDRHRDSRRSKSLCARLVYPRAIFIDARDRVLRCSKNDSPRGCKSDQGESRHFEHEEAVHLRESKDVSCQEVRYWADRSGLSWCGSDCDGRDGCTWRRWWPLVAVVAHISGGGAPGGGRGMSAGPSFPPRNAVWQRAGEWRRYRPAICEPAVASLGWTPRQSRLPFRLDRSPPVFTRGTSMASFRGLGTPTIGTATTATC